MFIYFPGCMATYRQKSTAKSSIRLLKKAKLDFKMLGEDEWCCGSILLRTGNIKLARDIARHNIDVIKKAGTGTVVTSCAGCYRTIKKDYPELMGPLGFDVIHITECIGALIDRGNLKLKEKKARVTYHDPCHLGRHMGSYDIPRTILKKVPGVQLIEMKRIRENARCCGAGGGMSSANKQLATQIADIRFAEAEATGAEILVTACPFCVHALSEAGQRKKSPMKVMDFSEFMDETTE